MPRPVLVPRLQSEPGAPTALLVLAPVLAPVLVPVLWQVLVQSPPPASAAWQPGGTWPDERRSERNRSVALGRIGTYLVQEVQHLGELRGRVVGGGLGGGLRLQLLLDLLQQHVQVLVAKHLGYG